MEHNTSPSFCRDDLVHQVDLESWNGSSWTEINDLNTARNDSGSRCNGTTAVWCCRTRNVIILQITENWNGSAWRRNDLNTAKARHFITGAGSTTSIFYGWNNQETITESWDGSSWTADLATARHGGKFRRKWWSRSFSGGNKPMV